MTQYLTGLGALILLSACASTADPEPYMGFECEQLRMMSDTSGPMDPFAASQVGSDPQSGLIGDRQGLATENVVSTKKNNEDMRAVRAAYRQKNCK